MARKYDAVLGRLKRVPTEFQEGGLKYQERVDLKKAELRISGSETSLALRWRQIHLELGTQLDALGKVPVAAGASAGMTERWLALRDLGDMLDEISSHFNLEKRALEELMEKSFTGEALESLTLASGRGVGWIPEPYVKIKDPEKFDAWCREKKYDNEMHLHPSTTASIVKTMLLANQELPEGVEVYWRPKWQKRS